MYFKITKLKLSIILICSLSLQNYSSDNLDETPATEEENNMTPNLFPNLIANEKDWNKAKEELNNNNEALKSYNSWIESKVGRAMASTPYATYKLNKREQSKVQENAKLINIIAIGWFFMDKDTDKAKARLKKVTQLIYKWASSNTATGHTPVEAIIMPIYESYSLIRTYIKTSDREKIDKWIQKRVDYFKGLNLGSINTLGNWNTIRISFLFQFALILEDQILYEYAIKKFESHIEKNLLPDGKSYDFIKRDAFAYHAYNLQFYARILKSVGMFKGKQEALKLYQQKNSSGGSIEKCVQYWEPFLIDPQNNIHLEFVNTSFSGDKTRGDYNKPYSPNGSVYVLDELRYIEPECSRYIQSINLGTRYNRNFKYWINSVIIANPDVLSIKDDVLNGSLSMYPNPVNNVLNINNPDGIIIKNISLINTTGKTVYSGGNTATINVSSLAKGVYILKITSAQGVSSKKIIVK